MTLSRKILLCNVALLCGLTALAAASLWGVRSLRRHEMTAAKEYAELRQIEAARARLTAAAALLQSSPPDMARAGTEVRHAIGEMQRFQAIQSAQDDGPGGHEVAERRQVLQMVDRLHESLHALSGSAATSRAPDDAAMLSRIHAELGQLEQAGDDLVATTQRRSSTGTREATVAIASTFMVIAVIATLISIAQYRSVMRPLEALRDGVRRIASGRFEQRLIPAGDREFVQLTQDFNRMAAELDDLYRDLEQKVASKSRELVQSERLASVGFLAAGVAHEINNPLGIMAGFAELSLKRLRTAADLAPAVADARRSLQIIRDEAFRCREITEKLLTLAKGSKGGDRQPVSLAAVIQDVVSMVSAHQNYRGRAILTDLAGDELVIPGDDTELKQVMLNLTINALDAVDSRHGQVRITSKRDGTDIEICVQDNGCGMTQEVRQHVFEPFFSTRRGQDRGLGLGLSITHAIVESYGGVIQAHSDGPGLGSRFVLRLPTISKSHGHDAPTEIKLPAVSFPSQEPVTT